MPKITEKQRSERRDQILAAASRCFVERGFQATSMADIIKESGLSAGAIYLYFPGKRDIAIEVFQRAVGELVVEVTQDESDDARAILAPSEFIQVVSTGFDRRGVHPSLLIQMWGEAATDPDFRLVAVRSFTAFGRNLTAYLSRWARQSKRLDAEEADGWAEMVFPALLGLLQGYFVQRAVNPEFDEERYLSGVAAVLG